MCEGFDDRILCRAEDADPLRRDRHVVRARGARQAGGVLDRELVRLRGTVVGHDPAGDHRSKPLADVALTQTSSGSDLRRARRRHAAHDVEEACPMPDAHHERQRAVVDYLQGPFGKRIRNRPIATRHDVQSHVFPLSQRPDTTLLAHARLRKLTGVGGSGA